MTDVSKPLSLKQLDFASRFLSSGDAGESYRRVYGCAKRSAEASASRLLDDPRMKIIVEQALRDARAKVGLSAERLATALTAELQGNGATPAERAVLLALAAYLLASKPAAHQPVSASSNPDSPSAP